MIHFYDLHTTIPVTTRYVSNAEPGIDGRDERLRNILNGSSAKGMTISWDSARTYSTSVRARQVEVSQLLTIDMSSHCEEPEPRLGCPVTPVSLTERFLSFLILISCGIGTGFPRTSVTSGNMHIAIMEDKIKKKVKAAAAADISGKRTERPLKTKVSIIFLMKYEALPDTMWNS